MNKTIIEINGGTRGSTNTIARLTGLAAKLRGYEIYHAFPLSGRTEGNLWSTRPLQDHEIKITGNEILISKFLGKLTGFRGCFNYFTTKKFLRKIDSLNPSILHLHNLHGNYINLRLLFDYIKRKKLKIVWTLHDCWSFTARCPYFTISQCEKWRTGCHNCPTLKEYPGMYIDQTKLMWKLKRKWFTGIDRDKIVIVCPSKWLADLARESYLGGYDIRVIHNGINLDTFKPTPGHFRANHNIPPEKFIVLGVAAGWGVRKGFDVFARLARELDSRFQVVIVGEAKGVADQMPENLLHIQRTWNAKELAEIYTESNVFANPTREENYPTVNLEAVACGTPVVTFRTGGSPETIDESCGVVVDYNDYDSLKREIIRVCETRQFTSESCINYAHKNFNYQDRMTEYVNLFDELMQRE